MTSLYAIIITLVYLGLFFLRVQDLATTLWLALGFAIGFAILEIDELIAYRWYNESNERLLITRSPFFLILYLPLAVYVLTSSGSVIGSGVILGIGFLIWVEMIVLFQQPQKFKEHFLKQVAVPVTQQSIHRLCLAASVSIVFLASILLW